MDSEGKGCCLFYAIGGIAILFFALVGGSNGTASDGDAIVTMIVLVGAGIAAIAVMAGGKSSSNSSRSSSHTNKKINYPSPPAFEASSGSEAYDEGYYYGFQDGKKAAESNKDKKSFYKCYSPYYGYYEKKYQYGYFQGFEYAYKAFKG